MTDTDYLEYPLLKQILKSIGKFILFLVCFILLFILGLFIGYAVMGGGHFWEVLNRDTWMHIFDFLK
ncbi:DNA-directed RNA polymerase subunit beta [Facklamia sp. DSM 111018]|uniref:DNA-directed RNA polymerase subunit beta n=1 Tax=Facklamia lactis TaxID=2749967 RepID=A0ABS0LNF2_9LACT|nr:DNA-directed RNA polymerase subunit beta [Facklamia lactis]MBG9979634.1 DNA-directed RNA polymerase subunit beta [Facklamia lactis]MBG9985686.1 DNA-directed RNA polymerase subunit beta [Facklamia lactis]